ncbi:vacuolar-processing enzyme beta-isozyme-like [Zingiber officinale]|uniref:vacuolar-processing enzyme beta-isozyme-like n=1 Tax=Zingiber officinale TaxID=94328 RepID=UPI001C4A7CD5|nr:vacuolar-processing enzyme beta-isozyme-like [Zingiber officinale]
MRTSNQSTYSAGSHVMEYGDKNVKPEKLYLYQGFDPANANLTENARRLSKQMGVINQRDADLLFLWHMYERLEEGSNKKKEILSEITEMMMHRAHLDSSIELIGNLIFGSDVAPSVLKTVRPSGQALVDDWIQAFELHCGSLTQYGMKYMRAFANICNEGVSKDEMEEACGNVCGSYNSAKWSPFIHGYSA